MKTVLIVVDSLKSTAPGYAGGIDTPFLDSLAEQGTIFNQMFASGAWTTPSLMSMLTGILGHRVGIARWRHPFPRGLPNLLTAFSSAGHQVSCFHPYPNWGLLTIPDTGKVLSSQQPDDIVETLRGAGDQFVLIHHWWTHLPYTNRELSLEAWHRLCHFQLESLRKHPEKMAGKLEADYLQCVKYFSEQLLPRYLDAASQGGDDVVLVVTGDHGETWGESHPAGYRVQNVYDLHGRWITDETVQVPLVCYGKNIPAGQTLGGFARGVDIAPTLCELSGVPWPGPAPADDGQGTIARNLSETDMLGLSLAQSIYDGTSSPHGEALTVSSHNAFVPRTYPDKGTDLWRLMALRQKNEWLIWDGVSGQKSRSESNGYEENVDLDNPEVFTLLEAARAEAVDPGELVAETALDDLRGDTALVEERLRCLGYLE